MGTSPRVTHLGGSGCSSHTHPQPLPMGMAALQTQTGPNPAPSLNSALAPVLSSGEVPGTSLRHHRSDSHLPHKQGPSPTTPHPFLPQFCCWMTLASPLTTSTLGTLFSHPKAKQPTLKAGAQKSFGAMEAPRTGGCGGGCHQPGSPPILYPSSQAPQNRVGGWQPHWQGPPGQCQSPDSQHARTRAG